LNNFEKLSSFATDIHKIPCQETKPMTLNLRAAAIAGFSLFIVAQMPVNAQAPAPPPAPATPVPAPANDVNGVVSAVDTTANTITVHDRRTDADVLVTVTGDTKFSKQANVGLAGLAAGTIVSVRSDADIAAGSTSVDGNRIAVLPKLPPMANEQNPRLLIGTVATTTPSLTVTTATGTIVTINTTPDTEVMATQPAALTDITVGERVMVAGKNDGTTLTAREVRIAPARVRRERPAGAPAPPPAN
jgi:hypothetical protein